MYNKNIWTNEIILAVWQKGQAISKYDSNQYRIDECGAWMEFDKHGDREAIRGWEIDHIKPKALGGDDALSNLQPLHWKNNVEKGDSSYLKCAIRS